MRISLLYTLSIVFCFPFYVSAQNWDIDQLRKVNTIETHSFSKGVSNSLYIVPIASTVGILAYGLIEKDQLSIENGITLGASMALNTAVTMISKKLIDRDRPYITYPELYHLEENSGSMPSGHTSLAFNFATTLSLQYPKWYIIAPSFAWATTMGYARMNLGVHYPSDVFAGALVGSACAFATFYANKWIRNEWVKPQKAPSTLLYY